jgi:uncharacterized membrane protein
LKSRRAEGNGMDLQEHRLYVGPIPSPDIIKEFSEIDPSFPERLMALGEVMLLYGLYHHLWHL